MNRKLFIIVFTLFITLAFTVSAFARWDHRPIKRMQKVIKTNMHPKKGVVYFQEADVDDDKQLSKQELTDYHNNFFDEADIDKNEYLTEQEIIDFHKIKKIKEKFAFMDTDKDGFISEEEHNPRGFRRRFAQFIFAYIDTDEDGSINEEEFIAYKMQK
ncbi:MAG: hypothetical protein B6I26_01195 [Desulfobacteraceae bacterium 4572_130]|nr:MAG: hypothetical protein B6I26_01195 [Desulfobacteraceae bacterium 4572_130]